MRSRLAFAALIAAVACNRPEPPPPPAPITPAGVWEGALISAADTHAVRLSLEADSTGLRGFLDLPDQYAHRYAVKNLSVEDSAV